MGFDGAGSAYVWSIVSTEAIWCSCEDISGLMPQSYEPFPGGVRWSVVRHFFVSGRRAIKVRVFPTFDGKESMNAVVVPDSNSPNGWADHGSMAMDNLLTLWFSLSNDDFALLCKTTQGGGDGGDMLTENVQIHNMSLNHWLLERSPSPAEKDPAFPHGIIQATSCEHGRAWLQSRTTNQSRQRKELSRYGVTFRLVLLTLLTFVDSPGSLGRMTRPLCPTSPQVGAARFQTWSGGLKHWSVHVQVPAWKFRGRLHDRKSEQKSFNWYQWDIRCLL